MAVQIKQEQSYAYAELLEILSFMEEKYVSKIPNKLLTIFKTNSDANYEKHINPNLALEEQNISKKTSALLAMLMLNYWCENEEQKTKLKNMFDENEQKYQKELREKYNPDTIFNSNNITTQSSNSNQTVSTVSEQSVDNSSNPSALPVDYSSFTWYKKLLINIKKFIYKLFK